MTALAISAFYRVPVFGWAVRDVVHGASDAKLYFVGNLVMSAFLLVGLYGYPAAIVVALCAVAAMFVALVAITSYGMFWGLEHRLPTAAELQARNRAQTRSGDRWR